MLYKYIKELLNFVHISVKFNFNIISSKIVKVSWPMTYFSKFLVLTSDFRL